MKMVKKLNNTNNTTSISMAAVFANCAISKRMEYEMMCWNLWWTANTVNISKCCTRKNKIRKTKAMDRTKEKATTKKIHLPKTKQKKSTKQASEQLNDLNEEEEKKRWAHTQSTVNVNKHFFIIKNHHVPSNFYSCCRVHIPTSPPACVPTFAHFSPWSRWTTDKDMLNSFNNSKYLSALTCKVKNKPFAHRQKQLELFVVAEC